jgi:predicted ArsR family transcriptional regulator
MILGDIRDYVKQHGTTSLNDIALHFDIAPDTVRFAIDYWQRKGKIREQAPARCDAGSCGECGSHNAPKALYEWVRRDIPVQWVPFHRREP